MKYKPLLLYASLLLLSASSYGQTFNWNDKDFKTGSKRMIHILYSLDKPTFLEESKPILDTVVSFLKKNPTLKIEIANHTDQQGSEMHNKLMSQARSQSCVSYLRSQGIDSARVSAKGYGYSEAIIPISVIQQMKTKREKDSAYRINRRTEVRITSTCYKHETFNWNDSVFYVGSKRRIRIMYDLDKCEMLQESKKILDTVITFMKRHPLIKIEVASHTDQQGSYSHNKILSQARAQACVNYIRSQGIDSVRVVAKGYWFSEPIIPLYQIQQMKTKQEKDAAYAINRRTEIVIIGK